MRRFLTCLILACVCVPAFADDSSNSTASTATAPEAAMKDGTKQFDAAWAKHDAKAIAAFYATDGDVVTPDGNTLTGRDGIEQWLTDAFNGQFKDSTLTTTVEKIRLIKPDVAIVDSTAQVKTADGQITKAHLVSVLLNKDGKWVIETMRAIVYQ